MPTHDSARLRTLNATIGYDGRSISTGLSIDIYDESFTAIIGPNGCDTSMLLRALARVLTPIMLLDEPTTSLNILHQYDLMELLHTFHGQGKQS